MWEDEGKKTRSDTPGEATQDQGDMTESRTAERCEDSRSHRPGCSNDSTMAQLGVSASVLMAPVMEPTWQLRKTGCSRGTLTQRFL